MDVVTKNIKSGMIYLEIHPREMARACKVTERTFYRWMKEPQIMQIGYLEVIAKKLGTTAAELLREGGEEI